MRVLLASGSPRRRQFLLDAKVDFRIAKLMEVDESFDDKMDVVGVAQYLAGVKADAYFSQLEKNEVLLTADTVVIVDNKILGKPVDKIEAIDMLMMLSGVEHRVITGVVLRNAKKEVRFSEVTKVFFKQISRDQAQFYAQNYNPFDKAGGYGIQDDFIAQNCVERVEGLVSNVIGLPIERVLVEVEKLQLTKTK